MKFIVEVIVIVAMTGFSVYVCRELMAMLRELDEEMEGWDAED